jgi:hypothetical protein
LGEKKRTIYSRKRKEMISEKTSKEKGVGAAQVTEK